MNHDAYGALDALYVAAVNRGDQAQADLFETTLERLATARPLAAPDVPAVARWYAAHRWPVFALPYGSKKTFPRSHGFKDASVDDDDITAMFTRDGPVNIGLATGHGFDAVDVDPAGHASVVDRLRDDPDFPPVFGVVLTPRRGLHLWVPPTGRGNTTNVWLGVDYRGLGGYVVAPPSYVDEDDSHGHYVWLVPPVKG